MNTLPTPVYSSSRAAWSWKGEVMVNINYRISVNYARIVWRVEKWWKSVFFISYTQRRVTPSPPNFWDLLHTRMRNNNQILHFNQTRGDDLVRGSITSVYAVANLVDIRYRKPKSNFLIWRGVCAVFVAVHVHTNCSAGQSGWLFWHQQSHTSLIYSNWYGSHISCGVQL